MKREEELTQNTFIHLVIESYSYGEAIFIIKTATSYSFAGTSRDDRWRKS